MGESGNLLKPPDEQAVAMIRAGLERVLASDAFRAAPQLSAFLAFVVERTIDGRGAELKGYTIAVEALGRPADFDPQADPIVRVEAGRLRRTLSQYYAGEGQSDPVRITMPVGGYVPVFEPTGAEGGPPPSEAAEGEQSPEAGEPEALAAGEASLATAQRSHGLASRRWPAVLGFALVIGIGALAGWYFTSRNAAPVLAGRSSPAPSETVASSRPAAPSPTRLTVVAVMVPDVPADPKLAEILRRFSGLLVDALARFDDLVSIKAPPPGAALPQDVDYVFEMSAQSVEGATEGFGRLRSVQDGRIVWTASSARPLAGGVEDPDLAEIARRLAVRLAEPYGIIHADSRQFSAHPAMRCILQTLDVSRTMTADGHLAARTCITELVGQDPGFYPAWAHLAFLTLREHESGINPLPGPPLDRALSAALTAVRLAPSSARALQAMMAVLFARGAIEEALRAGREAMVRNPYDPDIMADLGSRYVRLNRPAEGLPLLERAIASSAGHPPWYDFYAFLAAHLMGAKNLADPYAAVLAADPGPLCLLSRALHAASSGDQAGLAQALERLAEKEPSFGADPRLYLSRKAFDADVIDRILRELGPGLQPR
jgi:hypothetical protein